MCALMSFDPVLSMPHGHRIFAGMAVLLGGNIAPGHDPCLEGWRGAHPLGPTGQIADLGG